MSYYFKVEKMSVGYQKKPLIENIEVSLEKGEILTLIGPNGAGKSTILKSIARQLALIKGAIYLDQKRIEAMSNLELSQTMSVMLTDKIYTEMMTCEDVVASGRYPYTGRFGILSKKDKKVVKEAMELVQVIAIKEQDFTQISDGQRQRVMLARCLCQEPELIILDEPTSYLDIKYKLDFLSTLQELRKKKKLTVIMSLHELELAEKISDKILCVNRNHVERFGKPEEVFTQGYLSKLFAISTGSFNEETGTIELSAIQGEAKIFVIAGGGTGQNTYRFLQRKGLPFATGILFQNDLDYPVAKALASEVIEAESFEPITTRQIEKAKESIQTCEKVICCKRTFGTFDAANQVLLTFARECGKQIEEK